MRYPTGRQLLGALFCAFLGACSGGNHAFSPPSPNDTVSGTQAVERTVAHLSGASSQQEQLYVLLESYRPQTAPYTQKSYFYRYLFGSSTPAATMQVPNFQNQMAVSATRYVITAGETPTETVGETAVNVYGPTGTHTTFTTPNNPNLLNAFITMSTDGNVLGLISFGSGNGNNAQNDQVVEYRAPFTTPLTRASVFDPAPGGGLQLLNRDGSQAVGIVQGDFNGWSLVADIPSGKTTTVTPPDQSLPLNAGDVYDGTHSWLYAFADQKSPSGSVNRIEIFDTAQHKYLGYINIPSGSVAVSRDGGLAVNQATSELYAVINNKVYVYNVPACHCTKPVRVLNTDFPFRPADLAPSLIL